MSLVMSPKHRHLLLGVVVWGAIATGTIWFFKSEAPGGELAARLKDHVFIGPSSYSVRFPPGARVSPGDAVLVLVDENLTPAGVVSSIESRDDGVHCSVDVFPDFDDWMTADCRMTYHRTSGNVGWVVKTLLPPEKLDKIRSRAVSAWNRERGVLLARLRPALAKLVDEAVWILKDDFPQLVESNREEFDRLGTAIRQKLWERHLDDVFRDNVWPLVLAKAEPVLGRLTDELVNKAPLFDFGWAYIVQKTPFGDDERLAREVRIFLNKEVRPIVKRYEGDFAQLASEILRETLVNEKFRNAFEVGLRDLGQDTEFRASISNLLNQWVLENKRLRELFESAATRPEIRSPIDKFLSALDPDIQAIGNMLLLNNERDGINPDLARILRRKLLRANASWILLERGESSESFAGGTIDGRDGGIR